MNRFFSLLVLLASVSTNVFAQNTIFLDTHPHTQVVDFVLPERLTVTKTIYADNGKWGVLSRANGHIFVLSRSNLVCYNTDAVQIGPVLESYDLMPHFDEYLGDLACLVHLKNPKNKNQPYAIMYTSGSLRYLPYTSVDSKGFIDGLAVVYDNKTREHYLIDHHGNVKAKGYDKIGPLTDERRAVRKRTNGVEKWGFMDRDCKVIIEPKYYEVGIFSDQVAWVRDEILSEPYLINQFGGEIHFKNNLFVGNIDKVFDFIRGEALIRVEKSDGSQTKIIIDKSGNPLVQGDWLDNIWLTNFDNEHAEYFFEMDERDEEGFAKYCSTKGNQVHGLTGYRRHDAFQWEGCDGIMQWHPTALPCWEEAPSDGDIYSEDHIVWRCNNPSEDLFCFVDEFDGIAMWDYKENTFISSSIRKSEKVELGAEFTNVVRIASIDDNSPTIWPESQTIGTARIPDDDGDEDKDSNSNANETISSLSSENQSGDGTTDANVSNTKVLTLSLVGNVKVEISVNGTAIGSGERVVVGTQVTVVCTPVEGSAVSSVKLNGSSISAKVDGNVHTVTFQMPSVDSVISVELTGDSE